MTRCDANAAVSLLQVDTTNLPEPSIDSSLVRPVFSEPVSESASSLLGLSVTDSSSNGVTSRHSAQGRAKKKVDIPPLGSPGSRRFTRQNKEGFRYQALPNEPARRSTVFKARKPDASFGENEAPRCQPLSH